MIEHVENRILWEDGDYEMGRYFLDADPAEAKAKMTMMGIDDDYYTAIAPDPTDAELAAIRRTLHKLCCNEEA